MRYKEINTPVEEAAMNPSSFADSISQAQGLGVLVGFEFEVIVPADYWTDVDLPDKEKPEITKAHFLNMLLMSNRLHSHSTVGEIEEIVKHLRFRNRQVNWNSELKNWIKSTTETAEQVINNIVDPKILEKIKPVANEISDRRQRYQNGIEPFWRHWMIPYILMYGADALPNKYTIKYYNTLKENDKKTLNNLHKKLKFTLENFLFYILDLENTRENTDNLYQDFDKIFDYDPATLYNLMGLHHYEDTDEDDDEDSEAYKKSAAYVYPAISETFGTTHIFNHYHERKKNATDWYIEPDGSLEGEDAYDKGVEIVTPPMKPHEAMAAVKKFYELANQLDLYTNESTGLHINVSIPKDIDVLKLAMFVGDKYVLKHFGREFNSYANSTLKDIEKRVSMQDVKKFIKKQRGKRASKLDMSVIYNIARSVSDRHTTSVNTENDKYVSFRHTGDNYLKRPQDVINVVGRFVRAIVIASSDAYQQEYYKKIYKLLDRYAKKKIQDPELERATARRLAHVQRRERERPTAQSSQRSATPPSSSANRYPDVDEEPLNFDF